jgi:hypothetical protein
VPPCDEDTEILFLLTKEVDAWAGAGRAAGGVPGQYGGTDWELFQILNNKQWWPKIKWIDELGEEVKKPFEPVE